MKLSSFGHLLISFKSNAPPPQKRLCLFYLHIVYWTSISVVDLCRVHTNSLLLNLLCPVTKAPEVMTLYPICSNALSTLKVGVANSTRRFFSSLSSGRVDVFSDRTRNSLNGSPSTVQLKNKQTNVLSQASINATTCCKRKQKYEGHSLWNCSKWYRCFCAVFMWWTVRDLENAS